MSWHRHRPLYSACNEDTRSELLALDPGSEDTVVVVAAGGGRALSLLAASPGRLIAVDRREDQVINLELKAVAMGALDRDAYAEFLGLSASPDREEVYAALRPSLTPSARCYWDARRGLIREGVLYAGRCERALFLYARLLQRLGVFDFPARLLACETLEEQHLVIAEEREAMERTEIWWHLFVNPVLFYAATQDPSFLHSTHGSMGRYLYRRFLRYTSRNLLYESFLSHLIYYGRYPETGPLPIYLEPEGFDRARKSLDVLEIRCSTIEDTISHARLRGRLKWSLSDISAWMSEGSFQELVRTLCKVGAPGSRICARNFAAHRSLPDDLRGRLERLDAMCRILDDQDSSMFFRFEVAEYRGLD